MTSDSPRWQDLVARKRQECKDKIPREWTLSADLLAVPPRLLDHDLPRRSGLLSELELDLTENYTASQLLPKLASGQVSSLVVTTAFCKRAAIAQQVVSGWDQTREDRHAPWQSGYTLTSHHSDIMPYGDVFRPGLGSSSILG